MNIVSLCSLSLGKFSSTSSNAVEGSEEFTQMHVTEDDHLDIVDIVSSSGDRSGKFVRFVVLDSRKDVVQRGSPDSRVVRSRSCISF